MDTHKLQQKQQEKATSRLHELFEQCRAIERAEKQEADEHKHQTILSTVRNFKSTLVHTLEQLTKATSEHKAALHNHVQHEREHRKKRLLLAEHENLARRQEAALGVKNEKLERSRQRVCGRALERTERRRIIEQNRALSCSPSLFMPLPAINALLRRGTFATTVQQCREEVAPVACNCEQRRPGDVPKRKPPARSQLRLFSFNQNSPFACCNPGVCRNFNR
jgi:hypothetical protein